jgi:hypothetical protein
MPASYPPELLERYHKMSDEELLSLATQRNDLTPIASAMLDEEISQRHLELPAEEQASPKASEVPPPELPVVNEVPPIEPQELPADWFNDDLPAAEASIASIRPRGITVLAYMYWLGAVTSGCLSVVAFTFGAIGSAVFSLLWTVACIATAIGLWRMRDWARVLALCLVGLAIVRSVLSMLMIVLIGARTFSPGSLNIAALGFDLFSSVFGLLFGLIVFRYLQSVSVKHPEIWR